MQEVLLDYGLEGYGLYWYCIELIALNVTSDKLTFELEHDCRIIARNTGSTPKRVQEMMSKFIDLGLFDNAEGRVVCLRLAKRCDDFTAKAVRSKGVQALETSGVRQTPTLSEKVPLEVEVEVEVEKNIKTLVSRDTCNCPVEEITSKYNEICKSLPAVKILSDKRKKAVRARWKESEKHQTIEFWERYFHHIESSDFLTGRSGKGAFGFDWIFNPTNFVKIIEGNYVNREYQQ